MNADYAQDNKYVFELSLLRTYPRLRIIDEERKTMNRALVLLAAITVASGTAALAGATPGNLPSGTIWVTERTPGGLSTVGRSTHERACLAGMRRSATPR